MAEKRNGIPAVCLAPPDRPVLAETVTGQQVLCAVQRLLPDGLYIRAFKDRRIRPPGNIMRAGKRMASVGDGAAVAFAAAAGLGVASAWSAGSSTTAYECWITKVSRAA